MSKFNQNEYPETPAGRAGLKVGDKVTVIGEDQSGYPVGVNITLTADDGSMRPLFEGQGTEYFNGPDPSKPAAFVLLKNVKKISDIEQVNKAEEKTEMNEENECKLKPFAVLSKSISTEQANLMLSLAVKAGAFAAECADISGGEDHIELSSATGYGLLVFDYIGVNTAFDTYLTDSSLAFDENILTYQEAMDMLNKVLEKTPEISTEGNKMTTEKTSNKTEVDVKVEVKSFYVPIQRDAAKINAIFKRLEDLGVKIRDVAVHADRSSVERDNLRDSMGGHCACSVECWELIGVKNIDGELCTYMADYSRQYDSYAVSMTWEEMESYIISLEKPTKVKKEAGKLFQRKVKVVYTNDKQYHMKNVVSLVVNAEHKSVNVTYSEKKGRVEISSNVRIPFSEVKMVRFEGPDVLGATYNFRDGEVVSVTRDHKYQAFSTTQH